jgi:autotransporter-associated beta strand protein
MFSRSGAGFSSVITGLVLLALAGPSLGQTGTWGMNTTGPYSYSVAANWVGMTVPNGPGSTANFTTSGLTGPITVNLDNSPTLGSLIFDNPSNTYSYTLGSGTLTLNNPVGTPTIAVNNPLMNNVISATIAGNQGFVKSGAGFLTLTPASDNTMTGGINVSAGTLIAGRTATANPLGANAITLSGGNLFLGVTPGAAPIALTAASFNQDMVVEASATANGTLSGNGAYNSFITATVDGGTARTNNTWYEKFGNNAAPTTGLPMGTTFNAGTNNNIALFTTQASNANNTALFNTANPSGTLTFANPTSATSLAFLVSSGNGAGTLALTANLVGGGTLSLGNVTAPDWFGSGTTAYIANGRINNSGGGFANVNSGNPRLWEADVTVPAGTAPIQSISVAWTGGATTNTMVFGVSGSGGGGAANVTTFQDYSANSLTVTANSSLGLPKAGAAFGALSLGATLTTMTQGGNGPTLVAGFADTPLRFGATTLTGNGGIINDASTQVTVSSLSDGGTARTFTKLGAGPLYVNGNASLVSGSTIAVKEGLFSMTRTANATPAAAVTLGGGTLQLGLPSGVTPLASPAGFNQAMVVPAGGNFSALYITAAMDNGVGLTGNTYYEIGTNPNAGATTTGILMGPNTVKSLSYPGFSYLPQPANESQIGNFNTLMLDAANPTATMSFTGKAVSALSFLAASANGAQNLNAVVHFSDGSTLSTNPSGTPLSVTVPDWFNGGPIAEVANGRMDNNNNFNNVNSGNPRLYDVILSLPLSVQSKLVTSVDFSFTSTGNGRTAIFAVSGAAPAVAQTFTSPVTVTGSSTVDLESSPDAVTLGNLSINGSTLSMTGLNNGALTLGATTVTGNATFSIGNSTQTLTLGALNDNGTARTITKSGGGTLTLPAAATSLVTGTNFTATGGTVNLNNATSIGSAANVTANSTTINFGAAQTFASLAGNTSGLVNLNGNILTINGSASTSFSGVIADGTNPGGLVRAGTGRTTLTGLNTFTNGITVSGGTLATSAPGLLGNNLFTLQGTGTLSLAGVPPGTVGGFGGNGLGYTINSEVPVQGNAPSVANNVATMTSSTNNQTRSIWRNIQVPTTGNFTASWTWQVTGGSGGNPADGFAFALQNDPAGVSALGGGGGSLGYQALANSVALGTSVYSGNGVGGRGIRIYENGNPVNNASNNNGNFAAPGSVALIGASGNTSNPINYSLTYDATAMTLAVTLTDTTANTTFSNTFNLGNTLQSIIGNPTAFIGFTDATGGLNHTGVISNFNTSFPVSAQTTYSNNVVVPSGSPTIAVKVAAGAAVLSLGSLTMAGGTSLSMTADTGSTANLAYGLNFSGTTLSGATTFNVANNGTGIGTLTPGAVGGSGGPLTKDGAGTLVLDHANTYTGGTVILNGTVVAASDTSLGTGNVTGNSTLSTLIFTGTTATSKSFSMGGGTISVAGGQTVTFSSPVVAAVLDGAGAFTANGSQMLNVQTTGSANVTSTNAADSFRHFDNSGAFAVAPGVNSAGTSTTVHLNGFTNEGIGSVTIGALSKSNVSNFQSYGTMSIAPAAITDTFTNTTLVKNVGTTPLGFNGGSRTFIGTPQTAVFPSGPHVGQPTFVAGIDLNGKNAIVAGGLFVNNGYVSDSSNGGAGTGTVVADFGSLVKGAGFYQNTVLTQNGGKFQAGNSPGSASFGKFVLGPGGVSNYVFAIDDATGVAGPIPDAAGHVSGWGLVKAVSQVVGAGPTPGDFTWSATPSDKLLVSLQTLVNPTTVGVDIPGMMDNFDPTKSYDWPAMEWSGSYAGPTDAATLDAATVFDTSGFANRHGGTFGWSFEADGHGLSLTYTPSAVPEPSYLPLLCGGAAWAANLWRRRRSAAVG